MLCFLVACGDSDEQVVDEDSPVSTEETQSTETQSIEPEPVKDENSHIYIGTGSVQGVYFPIGGVICRLLNRHKLQHKIRCTLESTGGSINNLKELRDGNFDIVVAQSDWHHHAYHGTSTFEKYGENKELRSVFALEADPLALIVKKDSEITTFEDLEDRIVSLGYSRSLQHRIIDDYLDVIGWTEERFKQVVLMSDSKQATALCTDQVESILLLSSSLEDHLKDLPADCELRFLPLSGDGVKQVIAKYPYYRSGLISKDMYPGGEEDVMSFGLGATFVALESTSPKAVYHVVKEIVENFKDFKSLHPSLQMISASELPKAGLTAPLHSGAIRYYREARLL
ncbi:MAG: TAXI family TRAP transporter solute-binding subunit [Pseudomonadota bacterium]